MLQQKKTRSDRNPRCAGLRCAVEVWLSDRFFFGGPIRDIGVPRKFCEHIGEAGLAFSELTRSALVSLEKGWVQVDVAAPEL